MANRRLRLALWTAGLAAVCVLLLRFDVSSMPEVTRYRDDAYYYFVFVRNWASGLGPCVTPDVATNGVHVLWAILLLPLWLLAGDGGFLVGAQHLGLGLHVLTAVGLFLLLGGARGLGVALLYLGNPVLVQEAQNGQETALACAATLALWWGFGRRRVAIATAVAVLAVLARSDLVFLVAAFGIARFGWRPLAAVPLGGALLAYAGVDLALAGRVLQDSAAPIPWLFAAHFERTGPDTIARLRRFWWYLRPCLLGGPYGIVSPVFGGVLLATTLAPRLRAPWEVAPLVLTLLAAAFGASDVAVPLIGAALVLMPNPVRQAHAGAAYPAALAGFAALVVLHLVVRGYPRDYYFAPLGVLGALAFGGLAPRATAVAGVLLLGFNVWQLRAPPFAHVWQEQMSMAGKFLRTVVPAGEPVGCFNSGIVAFHDPGPVLNLDGVVNHEAFVALRAGALDAYLDANDVRFVVDSPEQLARSGDWPHGSGVHFGPDFDPDADLVEVVRFVVPGIGGTPFTAYWRRGRGAPPPRPLDMRVLGPAAGHGDRPAGVYVLWPAQAPGALELRALDAPLPPLRLLAVAAPTTVVLRVDAPIPGRYGLFRTGEPVPLLTLDL